MGSNSTLTDLSRLGLGYGIAIALGILVLITTITLASYVCVRAYGRSQAGASAEGANHATVLGHRTGVQRGDENRSPATWSVPGLDQATLDTYPKILYSKSKRGVGNSCCSICLGDYREAEVLRVLPDCGHMFHVSCIDAWLRLHATCPMCRTSPLPSPLSTPLSELVPLAVRSQR